MKIERRKVSAEARRARRSAEIENSEERRGGNTGGTEIRGEKIEDDERKRKQRKNIGSEYGYMGRSVAPTALLAL